MKTLKEVLEAQTQDLKQEYLTKTKEWADSQFRYLMKVSSWTEVAWCKYFGLTPELANARSITPVIYDASRKLEGMQFWSMPSGFYNTKNARKKSSMQTEVRLAKEKGIEKYIERELDRARKHYLNSLLKLSDRLVKKGIGETRGEELVVKKARIGVNLEMLISVDSIQVKAWTIVAEGMIQRPHYRYLVK